MRPLSRHFGEIHGVDVSDEMVRLAREKLRDIPHAHVHATRGSDLGAFADDSFELVYSYAVFQHIPSREVVLNYLRESRRVLKPRGILRCQINGLSQEAPYYDTWSGVRFSAEELARFAREHDFQLLAMEGTLTQYMWTTMRKQPAGWSEWAAKSAAQVAGRIRRVNNAASTEPIAPNRGRFASVSFGVEGLPDETDLNQVEVLIGGRKGYASYLGPRDPDGLQQLNVLLPEPCATGMLGVEVLRFGQPVASTTLRVIPAPPPVPCLLSVADAINLMSGTHIMSRSVKVVIEDVDRPELLHASIDGVEIAERDIFCADPRIPRYEVNYHFGDRVSPGTRTLELRLGERRLDSREIHIE
jgi:ubiquinone/menaquinone biosynthesis C-methylase UbiE